jgi:hypothetical protein
MKVIEYFKETKGYGVLATSDPNGNPNLAIYSRPHVIDDETIAFIMLDRLTYKNLISNPSAAYLFLEDGELRGVRLYITKIREEKNSELLYKIRRVKYEGDEEEDRFLVFFEIKKVLPLVGTNDSDLPYK